MTDKTRADRHAISRSTGATTWTRKNGPTPADFFAKCKSIVAGKADKITGDRFDLHAPTAKKAAAKKPATKATAKPAAKTV